MRPLAAILRRLADSPTATTFASFSIQGLQLLVVVPLVAARFPRSETTAFLLFSSILAFGMIVTERLSLTFTRLFAYSTARRPEDGRPARAIYDRKEIMVLARRVYGWSAFASTAVCALFGGLACARLLRETEAPGPLLAAFGVVIGSLAVRIYWHRFEAAMRGLGHLAAANRLNIVFNLVGNLAGIGLVLAGRSLFELVLCLQVFWALAGIRAWWLLRRLEGAELVTARGRPSASLWQETWEPTWKGLAANFSTQGVVHLAGSLVVRFGSAELAASYLLLARYVPVIVAVAQVPYFSLIPTFARLHAERATAGLRRAVWPRMLASLGLAVLGLNGLVFAFWLAGRLGLGFAEFHDPLTWLLAVTLVVLDRFNVLSLAVCEAQNRVVLYRTQAVAGVLGAGLVMPAAGSGSLLAVAAAVWGVRTALLGLGPARAAAEALATTPIRHARAVFALPLLFHAVLVGLLGLLFTLSARP